MTRRAWSRSVLVPVVLGGLLSACAPGHAPAASPPDPVTDAGVGRSANATCTAMRPVVASLRQVEDAVDAGATTGSSADAPLATGLGQVQAAANASLDDVVQQRLQDVADSVRAFRAALTDRTSDAYPQVLTAARARDDAFGQVCSVANPGFERGTFGWRGVGPATLSLTTTAHSGAGAVLVTNGGRTVAAVGLSDWPASVPATGPDTYRVGAWLRTDGAAMKVTAQVQEWLPTAQVGQAGVAVTLTSTWQFVDFAYMPRQPGRTSLSLVIAAPTMPARGSFSVDDVTIAHR